MASKALTLILRGLQFFWTVLILALTGHMISSAISGNPSIVNYTMFVAIFGALSLLYLIPTTAKEGLAVPVVTLTLDGLNTLFWLIAGIALAAELDVHRCSNRDYTLKNHVTNGSRDTQKRCHEAQASCAFLWFGFAAFAASTVFSFLNSRGSANLRGVGMGGIRRGGPSMSQV